MSAALDAGDRVVLEVEDRQVQIAVAQVVAGGPRAVDPAYLLHAEHVDVELGGRVHVLGRDGDVLDLRHGASPLGGLLLPFSSAFQARYAKVAGKASPLR